MSKQFLTYLSSNISYLLEDEILNMYGSGLIIDLKVDEVLAFLEECVDEKESKDNG